MTLSGSRGLGGAYLLAAHTVPKTGRRQSLFPSCRWGEWPEQGNLPGITQLGWDGAGIQPQSALGPSQPGGPQARTHTRPQAAPSLVRPPVPLGNSLLPLEALCQSK